MNEIRERLKKEGYKDPIIRRVSSETRMSARHAWMGQD